MINLTKNQAGQSLIEMLIALFILVIAMTATIVLVTSSIKSGRDSINKLIATNLAREGIEVVRNVRDSNWIEPTGAVAWDDGLSTDGTAIPVIMPHLNTARFLSLDFTPNDFANINTQIQIFDNIYEQGDSLPGSTDSNFYRLIYFSNICQDDNEVEEIMAIGVTSCNINYSKVGMRVVSEVRWPNANSRKKVQVEERLYNWQSL